MQREQGQTAAECLGVLLVIAVVIALLAASGIGPAVRTAANRQICAVLNDPTCAPPGTRPPRHRPALADHPTPRSYPGDPDTAEHTSIDVLAGFVRGVASQLADTAKGLGETAAWAWRSLTSHDQRVANAQLWAVIRDHPGEALQAIVTGITEPVLAEWRAGRPGAAGGRAVTEILLTVLGPKGLHRLRTLNWADETGAVRAPWAAVEGAPGFMGRRGSPLDVRGGWNAPTTINGRRYTTHALNRMQGRGVPPSAVEDAIWYGQAAPGRGDATVYYSVENEISVVVGRDGQVVTVSYGDLRRRP